MLLGANWVGPDRDHSVDNRTTRYRPLSYSAMQELNEDVGRLRHHAEHQRQTSGGD